jgi:hypothetical protein
MNGTNEGAIHVACVVRDTHWREAGMKQPPVARTEFATRELALAAVAQARAEAAASGELIAAWVEPVRVPRKRAGRPPNFPGATVWPLQANPHSKRRGRRA